MRTTIVFGSLAVLLASSAAASAQVVVSTPWVTVQVSHGGVSVQTPWICIDRGFPCAPPMRRATTLEVTDGTTTRLIEVAPPRTKALTLAEFATSFEPKPGTYDVELLHPGTKQPVQVSFSLPSGKPRAVRLKRREIVFDYGRESVAIRFLIGGRVQVRN
jgi:hypothetical protein